jgi:hypothetical protein
MNTLKIEQLVKRYQVSDPIMFEILTGLLDEVKKKDIPSGIHWSKPKQITTHLAADFAANGGATWSVVGVADPLRRTYMMSADDRLMYYTCTFGASTITGSGAGTTQLSVALPAGYKIRGGELINDFFCGAGHSFPGGTLETLIVTSDDPTNNTIVRLFRPALAVWANHAANLTLRFTIIMPVERISAVAKGM